MGHDDSSGFRAIFACCVAIVVALNWNQAAGSSSPRQQEVHFEKPPSALGQKRLYSPPALPEGRRNAALQIFEKVHPSLTIHYNGFSRQGSLICYDMLNEVRTVDEARALMDVEFHLLDLMLEHYKVKKHMRIVDTSVVKSMLDIGSLFSLRFPETISNVTRFIREYDPILRVFLKRYIEHIELLVLVNVPAFLAPIIPTIASRIMGISASKIVAIADGSGLERYMEKKYIPKEFGNPSGFSVKDNNENTTASCLMLQEIQRHLGESALSKEGRKMLDLHGPRLLATRGERQAVLSERRKAAPAQVPSQSADMQDEVLSTSGSTELNSEGSDGEPFDDIE